MASQSTPDKNGSKGTWTLKTGLAQMLKGGVIMDVVTPEHAKIAEEAGAVAVTHIRALTEGIRELSDLGLMAKLEAKAEEYRVPLELIQQVATDGKLPVVLFCAGGIATPADAALMMQLGAEGNFVGSGIFKSADPARRAKAIVEATTHFRDAKL